MRDSAAVRSDLLKGPARTGGHRLRAVALLMALVFVMTLGYGAGAPLLPLYVKQFVGAAAPDALAWHVGAVGGAYTFALFMFAPLWGRVSDRRGVLIYVLLADRAVEIVADRGVHARVSGPQWEAICRAMEAAFRHTEYRDGAINGIQAVAQHLKEHFPAYRNGQNELSDTPVVL